MKKSMSISELDPNFKDRGFSEDDKIAFHDICEKEFSVEGLAQYGKKFSRLPEATLARSRQAIKNLAGCTAGGVLRFRSDSDLVAIKAVYPQIAVMNHMPRTGSSAFEVYVRNDQGDYFYSGAAVPGIDETSICKLAFRGTDRKVRDFLIYLPLYNAVDSLEIGLRESCMVKAPAPWKNPKPLVFYGSSITQGGCASRPGLNYCAVLQRWLDVGQVNLGFSGNAWGEVEIAEYIASLEMSCFVMKYQANAPTLEHFQQTHWPFFEIIRQAQPELPIVISTSLFDLERAGEIRKAYPQVSRATYERAWAAGDKNVYFHDGHAVFTGRDRDCYAVDGVHPNDLGFFRSAKSFMKVLEEIYKP